jgi:hypothetical protein
MSYTYTNIAAAPTADDNGYVVSVDMKVGAYGLAATVPGYGARHVTLKRTVVDAVDTPGTVVVVGKDLAGQALTETLIPGANGVTVTGTQFFKSIVSITGVAWVIGGTDEDTIIFGWDAVNAVATGGGVFHGIVVNTTAAGAITITDARGVIAVIKASVAEGFYGPYDVAFSGYLRVETAAASDITVLHSESMPI